MQKGENEYQKLITKFLVKEISDDEIVKLKAWLDSNPENRRIFDEENELLQLANMHSKLGFYDDDKAWMHLLSRTGIDKKYNRSVKILKKSYFRILIAAASVACLLAIGGIAFWLREWQISEHFPVTESRVSTLEGEKANIFLADSTSIVLNSGSKLSYRSNYNIDDRIVALKGEAFFDVRTNPEKPFVVELNHMKISATGTRFNVFSFENEDRIETTLEEGHIQVSLAGKTPIDVVSGQQVVYFLRSQKIVVREVATETYTSWKENKLRFIDTPFEEVLRRIGRKYNVVFEINNKDLLELKYTATFIDESIEDVMQMLQTVSPIRYKIQYRTLINDKTYVKPKIIIGKRK